MSNDSYIHVTSQEITDMEFLEEITQPDSVEVPLSESPVSKDYLIPAIHDSNIPSPDSRSFSPNTSLLSEGMTFTGNALLEGPFNLSGCLVGNITQKPGHSVAVTVEHPGEVKGDITAIDVAVLGITDGIIDADQGEVFLHDSATVKGMIRYGRIKVNGADLNATLERVDPFKNKSK